MKPICFSVFIIVFLVLLTALSCKKPNDTISGGGKGGNAILIIRSDHYGIPINLTNGMAYIKYGAQDVPANGIYDDSVSFNPIDTTSQAIFDSLKNGQYFIMAYGVHLGYPQPNIKSEANVPVSKQDTMIVPFNFTSN